MRVLKVIAWPVVMLFRGGSRVYALIRDDQAVRDIYGDHPNGDRPTDRAVAAGVITNLAGGNNQPM